MNQTKQPISLLGLTIWFLAALFFLYEFFLRTFVGTVAQQVIVDLKLSAESFALVGAGYYFAYAAMQVPVGILVDKYGVKKAMIFATLACAGATYLFAHSFGFYSAFLSRMLMGFGSSFAFVCLLVVVSTWFSAQYFAFIAGISQFVGTLGPMLAAGPLVSLMAASHQTWRLALVEIGTFGVVLAVLVFGFVRNKPRDGKQVLVFLTTPEPIVSRMKRLVANRQAWCIALFSASIYVSLVILAVTWGTKYLEARGLSQALAADMISLAWLGYAIGCPVLGLLSDYCCRRKPFLVGLSCLGMLASFVIVLLPMPSHFFYALTFFLLGLAASGQNLGFAAMTEHTDVSTKATALGFNNGMIMLAGAIVPPIVSLVIQMTATHDVANYQAQDFTLGLIAMPLLFFVALVVSAFGIRETFGKPQNEVIHLMAGS